eukprot:scaffold29710_cov50-Cyclotella_meneghiniana.AAC.2
MKAQQQRHYKTLQGVTKSSYPKKCCFTSADIKAYLEACIEVANTRRTYGIRGDLIDLAISFSSPSN